MIPDLYDVMRYMEKTLTQTFPDYKTYVCWILSQKHYGKSRKYRKKG